MATVGTLWVDVRFNTGDLSRRLGAGLGAAGAGAGASLERSIGSRLTSIGASAANAGRQISLGLGVPLAAVGKIAADAFLGFDKAMTKITALAGVPEQQTKEWEKDVLRIGAAYGVAAKDTAEALYYINSSGIKAADALGVLEIAVKGQAVGLGTAQEVANATTSAMNAYGHENMSAARAADILTAAVREGKAEADQFAAAMSSIIPIGASLGISYEELGGAMASMSLSGTRAPVAATQLKGLMDTITDMPPIAQRALKAYTGIDYETMRMNLSSKGLVATLKEVVDGFEGNNGAMNEVFGNIRAYTGVLNILDKKEAQTKKAIDATTNSTGDFNRAMDATARSPAFKMEQAKTDLSNAMVEIGRTVVPALTTLTKALAGVADGFSKLPEPVKQGAVALGVFAALAGPVLYMTGSFLRLTGLIAGLGTTAASTAPAVGAAGGAAGAAGGAAGGAAKGFTAFAASMAGPFALAAATAIITLGVIKAKTDENTAAFAELATKGQAKNNQVETWDQLQQRIAAANAETEKHSANLRKLDDVSILRNNPIGAALDIGTNYDRHFERQAGETSTKVAVHAAKLAGAAAAVADKFKLSKDQAVQFVAAQNKLNPEIDNGTAAIAAYEEMLRNAPPAVAEIAAATEKAVTPFSSLIAKVQETSDAFFAVTTAEKSYADAQKAIADATQAVADAHEAYADAARGTEDAKRRVVESDRAVIKSGEDLAAAREKAAKAQQTLNDLLAGPSIDEQLDLKSAKLNVKEARKSLLEAATTDPLARERAQIALKRAQQDLKREQGAHDELVTGAREDLASATTAVGDAEESQTNAARAAIDARLGLASAEREQAKAFDAIAVAQTGVAVAQEAAVKPAMDLAVATSGLNDIHGNGTIKAKEFRDYLFRLKEMYPELATELQNYIDKFDQLAPMAMGPTKEELDAAKAAFDAVPTFSGPPRPASDREFLPADDLPPAPVWQPTGGAVAAPNTSPKYDWGVTPPAAVAAFSVPSPMLDIPVMGGDGATVGAVGDTYNIYEQSGKPRQTAYEVRREMHKESFLSGRRS